MFGSVKKKKGKRINSSRKIKSGKYIHQGFLKIWDYDSNLPLDLYFSVRISNRK